MRLTTHSKKDSLGYEAIKELVEQNNASPIIAKLGQLEDIEEGLGIDLITLFKASENGFYMINKGEIKFVYQGYQFNLRGHYIHLNGGYKKLDFKLEDKPFSDVLLFKDYGKKKFGGWALSKGELE